MAAIRPPVVTQWYRHLPAHGVHLVAPMPMPTPIRTLIQRAPRVGRVSPTTTLRSIRLTFRLEAPFPLPAAVPSGGDANLRFRFEKAAHPDVDPAFDTDTVVVGGATEATYTVTFAAQDAANTYSSLLMYVTERDLPVVVKNVKVTAAGDASSECGWRRGGVALRGPVGIPLAMRQRTPTNRHVQLPYRCRQLGWLLQRQQCELYPFSFPHGGTITFTGAVPSGGDVNVSFRFERLAHPDVDPAFNTDAATVSGAIGGDL